MNNKKLPPIHPGEILKEEFLDELGITQYKLAKDIHVPARRINEIVHQKRAVSADTALRLGRYFGIAPQFWINQQAHFDLEVQRDKLGSKLENEVKLYSDTGVDSLKWENPLSQEAGALDFFCTGTRPGLFRRQNPKIMIRNPLFSTLTLMALILSLNTAMLNAQKAPEWVTHRPRSEQFFYGRGQGPTAEAAEDAAHLEILVQLSSQVSAVARLQSANAGKVNVREKVEAFIGTTRLGTAVLEDSWKKGRQYWALVRYPEECGLALAKSTAVFYAKELNINPDTVFDALDEGAMIRGARMEQVLKDTSEGNYGGDISALFSGRTIRIQTLNFEAYAAELTPAQKQGLEELSRNLFGELEGTEYEPARITGHANPTGTAAEEAELQALSLARAQTMAEFLRAAGIQVGEVRGLGGNQLLGNPNTAEGQGLNRRVEIEVEVVQ